MTIEELNQLSVLERAIVMDQERLNALRESIDVKSPILTAMPKAPGAHDKIGETVPTIVDEGRELEERIRHLNELKEKLTRYIDKTGNVRMRMILTLRFMQKMSWQEVADYIGGKETEYSVKHACYRYVEGREDPEWKKNQVSIFDGEATFTQ